MRFYGIGHNTFSTKGMPWITRYLRGTQTQPRCAVCGVDRRCASVEMSALLEEGRAQYWPDLLGCGSLLLFVASRRFVDALQEEGIQVALGGRVLIEGPLPGSLSLMEAPTYYWIDGDKHCAAAIDYDASGYVDVARCEGCGRLSYDIPRTNARLHGDPPAPVVFDYNERSSLDLFTTDMNPLSFFCTERVFQCAKRHRLTNVAFRPVEEGLLAKPLKY